MTRPPDGQILQRRHCATRSARLRSFTGASVCNPRPAPFASQPAAGARHALSGPSHIAAISMFCVRRIHSSSLQPCLSTRLSITSLKPRSYKPGRVFTQTTTVSALINNRPLTQAVIWRAFMRITGGRDPDNPSRHYPPGRR